MVKIMRAVERVCFPPRKVHEAISKSLSLYRVTVVPLFYERMQMVAYHWGDRLARSSFVEQLLEMEG